MADFEYSEAFSRNLGLVTKEEQEILKNSCVAIPGMGGTGGLHALVLARLGIGKFHLADFDCFELANFNRQFGATLSTIGQPKIQVLAKMIKEINPEAVIHTYENGINTQNIKSFLMGADIAIDALDAFVIDKRELLFSECHKQNIPVITAGPIGMGTAFMIFMPGKMTFEQYFRFSGHTEIEKIVYLILGLTPQGLHLPSIVDRSYLDLINKRGPSTPMGVCLASAIAGTETLKILLKRGKIYPAPWYHHFDAYSGVWKRGYMFWGARNPTMILKRFLAKLKIRKLTRI